MVPVFVAMVVILVIAAVTAGLVVMGMEGRGRRRAPKLAGTMATGGPEPERRRPALAARSRSFLNYPALSGDWLGGSSSAPRMSAWTQ